MSIRLLSLSGLLNEGRAPNHPVAYRRGQMVTFAQFRGAVVACSRMISRRGYLRCGLLSDDSLIFAIGVFAILHAGAKLVLPPNGQPGTIETLSSSWDVLLSDHDHGPGSVSIAELETSDAALSRLEGSTSLVDFFTSGSSSQPKLVHRTIAELEAELPVVETFWGPRVSEGCVQATVSHQHIYGLCFKLLWPLASGRPFAAGMHELWETLLPEIEPGALLVSSPAHLSRLGGLAPTSARPGLILTAGAPLTHAAAVQVRDMLHRYPDEIYGSTETGIIATRTQESAGTPWRAFPGCEIRHAEDGRLVLKSPWCCGSDWLTMEDLVVIEGDGRFRLLGRSDRVAKIEGKRISLPAVEAALTALPQIADAAVVALTGARDQLGAVVVLTAQGRNEMSDLGRFRFGRFLRRCLAPQLEPMAQPRRWRFVTAIPTGPMGKRNQAALSALFEA